MWELYDVSQWWWSSSNGYDYVWVFLILLYHYCNMMRHLSFIAKVSHTTRNSLLLLILLYKYNVIWSFKVTLVLVWVYKTKFCIFALKRFLEFWALSCSFTSLIFFSQSRLVHGVEFLLLHMFHIALAWKFMFYASWYHPDPSSLFSQPSICSIHVSIYQRLPRHLPQYLTINSAPFACIS